MLGAHPYNIEALSGLAECSLRAGDLAGAEETAKTREAARNDKPGLKRLRDGIKSGFPGGGAGRFFLERLARQPGERRLASTASVEARRGLNSHDNDQDRLTGAVWLRASPFQGSCLSATCSHCDSIDTEPVFGDPRYSHVASIGAVGDPPHAPRIRRGGTSPCKRRSPLQPTTRQEMARASRRGELS